MEGERRDPLLVLQEKLGKFNYDFMLKSTMRHFKWATVYEGTESQKDPKTKVETKKRFSIKKFDSIVLKDEFFARHVLREIRLLNHFKVHSNVVHLKDVLSFPDKEECVLVITELLDLTLEDVFRSNYGLLEAQMSRIVYQLFFGLSYIHKAGVIHRDIAPSNLLLNAKCDLKITNFGFARTPGEGNLTPYVCSRYYRAPELVLDSLLYDTKVDVWSCGCIIAQMFNKKQGTKGGPYLPVFAGRTHPEQLQVIIDVVGTPSEEDISASGTPDSQDYLRRNHRHVPPKDLRKSLHMPDGGKVPLAAIKLIERMLMFNPNKRCTIDEAMRSKWLAVHFAENDLLIDPNPFTEAIEPRPQTIIHTTVQIVHDELQRLHQEAVPVPS